VKAIATGKFAFVINSEEISIFLRKAGGVCRLKMSFSDDEDG
jgi:hypothetical protein